MRGHTNQVKVIRGLRGARAERCDLLAKGGLRAEHQPVNALRVAYLREVAELAERLIELVNVNLESKRYFMLHVL